MLKYFERKEFTSDFFKKKRIIELGNLSFKKITICKGSGVGLLGVAFGLMGTPKLSLTFQGGEIWLTEQKSMLPILQRNARENIEAEIWKVRVQELLW